MGTNCALFLADLFLYSYENEFLENSLRRAKESLLESSISHILTLMTLSLSIIKDLRSSFLIFAPKDSQFSKQQNLPHLLLILICFSLKFRAPTNKLYDKPDAIGFHIVNFQFMSSNIQSAPAHGVYASQLIRYAHCFSNYSDFLSRHRALVTRLLSQGYKINRLSNTFKKFYGRHTDLVGQYKKNVRQMFIVTFCQATGPL